MQQDFYQALGVSADATRNVVKIAYEGKRKALERAGLPDAERKAEERLLEQAYVTLSNPAKKAWYDQRREAADPPAKGANRTPLIVAALAVVLLAGGAAAYSHVRGVERERIRLEEQRIAIERDRLRAGEEIAKSLVDDRRDSREASYEYRRELEQRRAAERDRYRDDANRRYEDARATREAYQQRANADRERRNAAYAEDRERRQALEDQRRAQAEVERQKRFVAEREREEERIRDERHNRARAESAAIAAREAAEARRPTSSSR